jgi:hypothetical protein
MPETQTGATPATPSATPGPNDQAPPVATGSPNPPPATPPAAPSTEPPATGAEADKPLGEAGQRALEEERRLRRDAEKLAKDEKKRADALESEKLTEDQRRTKRLDELEAEKVGWERERQQLRIEQAVARLTTKLKLVDVETVVRLVDPAKVEFDDAGQPTNVEDVVKVLIVDKPFLVSAGTAPTPPTPGINAGDGTSGGPPPNLTADELEAAKQLGMAPETYERMKGVRTLEDYQKAQPAKA